MTGSTSKHGVINMANKQLSNSCIKKPIQRAKIVRKPCKASKLRPAGFKHTKIRKFTSKKLRDMKLAKEYYQEAITDHIAANNGECPCQECGDLISHPTGSNVSHIVSQGANQDLYLDKRNNKILCQKCEGVWTSRSRKTMKIYPECMEIRRVLNLEYYTK